VGSGVRASPFDYDDSFRLEGSIIALQGPEIVSLASNDLSYYRVEPGILWLKMWYLTAGTFAAAGEEMALWELAGADPHSWYLELFRAGYLWRGDDFAFLFGLSYAWGEYGVPKPVHKMAEGMDATIEEFGAGPAFGAEMGYILGNKDGLMIKVHVIGSGEQGSDEVKRGMGEIFADCSFGSISSGARSGVGFTAAIRSQKHTDLDDNTEPEFSLSHYGIQLYFEALGPLSYWLKVGAEYRGLGYGVDVYEPHIMEDDLQKGQWAFLLSLHP